MLLYTFDFHRSEGKNKEKKSLNYNLTEDRNTLIQKINQTVKQKGLTNWDIKNNDKSLGKLTEIFVTLALVNWA